MQFKIKIKNIFLYILIILVGVLVIVAVCSNRYKFTSSSTIKYTQININNESSINEIVEKYSNPKTKVKFLSEIKKINNIKSFKHIPKKTLIIPIIDYQ